MAPKEKAKEKAKEKPKEKAKKEKGSKKKKTEEKELSIFERISEYFSGAFFKQEIVKTPVKGCGERMKNLIKNNYRGIIGVIVPLIVLIPQMERHNQIKKIELMWMWMIWFFLVKPVSIAATSLIPIFLLPMAGIMNSEKTCACYMNESIMLYILGGWLIVLLNNSGADKRIGYWFLCNGSGAKSFSGTMLVIKASTASFFLSMFSSRLITSHFLTDTITKAFGALGAVQQKGPPTDYTRMVQIINNAIHTSSAIGSIAIMHASYINVHFRGCYHESASRGTEYPDIFNYLQYSVFAFPVSFAMFIANLVYHLVVVSSAKSMTSMHFSALRSEILRSRNEIPPKCTLHETLSVLFLVLSLGALFFRWNYWGLSWASFSAYNATPHLAKCKDATVAAIFVIILHIMPKGFNFCKILTARTKSQLPPIKPESAILWWRFVDKNLNYGYLFTFGSAYALIVSGIATNLAFVMTHRGIGNLIVTQPWEIGLFLCVLFPTILSNIMAPIAACTIWLPLVMMMVIFCMSTYKIAIHAPLPWPPAVYIAALGSGVACNLGFCMPFQDTPAYHCHYTGKVPKMGMIKYSIVPVLLCMGILYASLIVYVPYLWDMFTIGAKAVEPNDIITTPMTYTEFEIPTIPPDV